VPYLLLVSFYSGQIGKFEAEKMHSINKSPYHGVAVEIADAYDFGKYAEKDFNRAVVLLKNESKKHIWPWVFFNRVIGYEEGERAHSPLAKADYFRRIDGMDLYNQTGALGDLYNLWRISLRIAKTLGSPGIVVDPEAYNNYRSYQLGHLAAQLEKPRGEIRERLRTVGRELADIVEKEYPEAILWFLFTGLGSPGRTWKPHTEGEYRTVSYVAQGILDRAKEKEMKLRLISGGELSLGYCYRSFEDLKKKIGIRNEAFSSMICLYPNLYLAGTISPWQRGNVRKNWMLRDTCGQSTLKTAEDFAPLIIDLLRSYQYVWIYAAMAAKYDPYDPYLAASLNMAIGKALNGVR
jgi:hypothetical protein